MTMRFLSACTHHSPTFPVNVRDVWMFYGETRACSSETLIRNLLAEIKNNDLDNFKDW